MTAHPEATAERHFVTPARVHYVTLVVGGIALLVIGRDQWFDLDDWGLLHRVPNLWVSHQGHWSTAPALLFHGLRGIVGFHSYLPYLTLAFLAHLAVVHLIWRIGLRAGVSPWLATGLGAVTLVLGCSAENLFWAFQVGFMGAVAIALVTVLLVDRPRLGLGGAILTGAIAVAALPFSGTALPVLAAAAVLSWVRRGFLRSVAIFAPAAVIYLVWYLLVGRFDVTGLAVQGIGFVTRAPLFLAVMFGAGYGQFVGILVLGPVIALALLVWLWIARRRLTGQEAPAYAVLLGSLVFAVLTSVSRAGGQLTAAGAERYVYVIVMLAIPTMGLALTRLSMVRRFWRVAIAVLLVVVGGVNIGLGITRANSQAVTEQRAEREFSAAAALVTADPDLVSDDGRPLSETAPDLTIGDVKSAVQEGLVSPVPYGPADVARVKRSLGLG